VIAWALRLTLVWNHPYHRFAMKTFSIECPDGLAEQLRRLVRDGWVADEQQAVVEALRRFLDSHRPELIESQVSSDVQWGLHGKD
jgi:hypothetical protein